MSNPDIVIGWPEQVNSMEGFYWFVRCYGESIGLLEGEQLLWKTVYKQIRPKLGSEFIYKHGFTSNSSDFRPLYN